MITSVKKNRKSGYRKLPLFFIALGIFSLILIGFLLITNIKINRKRDQYISRIEALKKEVQYLEQKKAQLEEKVSQAGSKEYLEKIAREQLNMKAPGEEVVVISKETQEEGEKKEEEKKSWWEWLKFWEE